MKKLLLSLLALLTLTSVAMAETVNLPGTGKKWNNYTWDQIGNNYATSAEGYSLLLDKAGSTSNLVSPGTDTKDNCIKVYAKAQLIVEAPAGVTFKSVTVNVYKDGNKATSIKCDWNSSATTISNSKATLTSETPQQSITIDGNGKQLRVASLEIVTEAASGKTPAGLSFPKSSYTANLGEAFIAPALTKATDATAEYISSKPEVATVNATTGEVKLVAAGKTTITAKTAESETYAAGSAFYELEVIDPNAPGTVTNPYTVAQALEACADAPKGVYVKGIVTEIVTEYNPNFGNVTYLIADEGATETLKVYRGEWGADITGPNDHNPEVGATVVVKGNLTIYGSNDRQFSAGSQIVSYTAPENPGPVLLPAGLEFSAAKHTVNVGETVDGLALTKPENNTGVVTYTSSDVAIATVNAETGAVTGVAAGTVTITATSTETDTYKAGKASYTLTVVDPTAPVVTGAMFDFTTADLAKLTTSSIEASKATTANATNDLTGVTLTKDGVTISFADGGQNKPRWWKANDGGTELRIYKGNTMTVTAPANMKLTSIEFTKGSNFALGDGSVGSIDANNNVWTPATQERANAEVKDVTFAPTDKTFIDKITVNYESINTGVDDILSDDANAPVEYYNLQGVRVANPESGLYIRVQGKKATKVLVK